MIRKRAFRVPLGFALMPVIPYLMFGRAFGNPLPVLAVVLTYALALSLGVPVYLLLRHLRRFSLRNAVLSGLSVLATVTFAYLTRSYSGFDKLRSRGMTLVEDGTITPEGWGVIIADSLIMGFIGAVAGLVFWLVVGWRAGDREPRPALESESGDRRNGRGGL